MKAQPRIKPRSEQRTPFSTRIHIVQVLLGDNRAVEPPDPIPNSVVKRGIADGSVGFPHVRVGHRQAFNNGNPGLDEAGVFPYGTLPGDDPHMGQVNSAACGRPAM